ncbi:conserved hypothetical protein [Culex quinquefasciatus]|uniref:Chitin-binding type-2 domain-containing protein n=1 Tax=Culex quinquefasciatus TaxID=7176 RepID=B0WLF4_CULQU|nr:conserved hypothetical protein [Culex quinquefasciatus]|eukprot:XP_001849538.1 conserved hypothetical protein [Culex quinquefasciatus]
MVLKWVLGVFAFTVGLQHVAESAGICGKAAIRRHWSDCRKFVECGEETTVVFQCPERSFFNPVTLVCDYAMYHECLVENNVDLGYLAARDLLEAKPGRLVMNSRCNELQLGAKFVNPEDCSQFYHCSPSGPMLFQCPGNLLFDSRANVCNWPQKVEDCSGITPGPTPNTSPGEGIGECALNCIPDGRCPKDCHLDFIFLPHPGSCSSYLACENGCACSRQCENGLYWSNRLQRCVPRFESECEDPDPLPCPDCIVDLDERCPLDDNPDYPTLLPLPDRCDGYLKFRGSNNRNNTNDHSDNNSNNNTDNNSDNHTNNNSDNNTNNHTNNYSDNHTNNNSNNHTNNNSNNHTNNYSDNHTNNNSDNHTNNHTNNNTDNK